MICPHSSVYISTRLVEGSPEIQGDIPFIIELAIYCSDCKKHVEFEMPDQPLSNAGQTLRAHFRFPKPFDPRNN